MIYQQLFTFLAQHKSDKARTATTDSKAVHASIIGANQVYAYWWAPPVWACLPRLQSILSKHLISVQMVVQPGSHQVAAEPVHAAQVGHQGGDGDRPGGPAGHRPLLGRLGPHPTDCGPGRDHAGPVLQDYAGRRRELVSEEWEG